jgi:hypothetical protein
VHYAGYYTISFKMHGPYNIKFVGNLVLSCGLFIFGFNKLLNVKNPSQPVGPQNERQTHISTGSKVKGKGIPLQAWTGP